MRYGKETDQETIIIEKVSLLLTVPKRRGRAMPCRAMGEAPGRSGGKGEEAGLWESLYYGFCRKEWERRVNTFLIV